MKLGYPCINRSIGCNAATTFRLASFTEARFLETVANNLSALEKILQYNVNNGFRFFRISSETIPFATHPVNKIDWVRHFQGELARIGRFINTHQIRISMHPDQFVLLNTPSETILNRSLADLLYHATFLESLGLNDTAKIQIHVGGIYGDKRAAIERFVQVYSRLTSRIKSRLVIENDERLYSLRDCLEISRETRVPILFDNFHHECLNHGETVRDALRLAASTWKARDGVAMIDYSEQEPGERRGRHATTISKNKFRSFLKQTNGTDIDIMLEIKDKEISAAAALTIMSES